MMKEKQYNEPIYSYLTKKLPKRFNVSILYHYTSFRAFPVFFGETADLYCTHFAALNDGAEIGHGWQMAIRYLNEHVGWTNEKCNVLWAYYKDGVLKNKVVSPWIMSFSLAEDSLPQWVAYTDKKEGGYALGLDRKQLEQMVIRIACNTKKKRDENDEKVAPFRMYVLPCLYSKSDKDVIEGLFEFYFNQDADVLDRVKNADKPIPKDMAKIVAKLLTSAQIMKAKHGLSNCEIKESASPYNGR